MPPKDSKLPTRACAQVQRCGASPLCSRWSKNSNSDRCVVNRLTLDFVQVNRQCREPSVGPAQIVFGVDTRTGPDLWLGDLDAHA